MNRFIVITGPTATGKTAISVALAKSLDTQIISADSCQIYKGMDIGTAKANSSEMQGVVHHFIDIAEPDEEYSAALFKKQAFEVIDKLNAAGKTPIVAGGTGLYVNSLVYELDFSKVSKDSSIRERLEKTADEKGTLYLYNILKDKDRKYAEIIAASDRRRIIRRLEIIEQGGSLSYDFRKPKEGYGILIIGLKMPRDVLYKRTDERVDTMLKAGLENEVKTLYNHYGDVASLKAIGYKEFIGYFKEEYDYNEAVRLIKRNTRRFAKRQLTWFNRDSRIKWFDLNIGSSAESVLRQITEYIKEKGF